MKKLLLILCLFGEPLYGAVNASAIWNVEQNATAGNVNGCGFVSGGGGTDYSKQTAAQYTFTDLATVDNDTVSSASHNFVAADVGNILHITAGTGFTAGWYEIVSVATNNADLDRVVGTHPLTGGTFYVGGACSLNSTLDDDFFEQLVAGQTVYVKYNASSYSFGETVGIAADATATSAIEINGYNTTHGDVPTGTNRPTIDLAGTALDASGANYFNWRHIIFTGTASPAMYIGLGSVAENLKVTNTSVTAGRPALRLGGLGGRVIKCELSSTNGTGLFMNTSGVAIGNYIHDSVTGIDSTSVDDFQAYFNIFDTLSTAGIIIPNLVDRVIISYNTFYGAETPAGTGIRADVTVGNSVVVFGNIFYGWATAVSWNAAVDSLFIDYNDFFNNTTDRTNVSAGPNDLAVDPAFTNAAGGNFSIGTALKAAGFPGAFPGSSTTGYLDTGAVQRQEPAGGSGGSYTFVQ